MVKRIAKFKSQKKLIVPKKQDLFSRVVKILEEARGHVIRAVNNNMVIAYWLVGREIVQEIQCGKGRAAYGKQVIEDLSQKLTKKYGRGFSSTNLRYFRTFYTVYADRQPEIRQIQSGELSKKAKRQIQSGVLKNMLQSTRTKGVVYGFSPNLGWSHYQALMGVEHQGERLFYEIEAENERWEVHHLERQIHTFLFARLLKSQDKEGVMTMARLGQATRLPQDTIKQPYVLDFLGLPDLAILHESNIEKAIIENLQHFLLELGKGFAFVGRQRRLQFGSDYFYVDLVFYNCVLKFYLLIDLKVGELTHQDIGQMDGYVRMFDDQYLSMGDNPTIGLILCAKKNETIAKYSVLKESKQIFASKYMLYLPTEAELKMELNRDDCQVKPEKLSATSHQKYKSISQKIKHNKK